MLADIFKLPFVDRGIGPPNKTIAVLTGLICCPVSVTGSMQMAMVSLGLQSNGVVRKTGNTFVEWEFIQNTWRPSSRAQVTIDHLERSAR
jgi:hypothetical protein